jgi:hypothetical protein
MLFSCLASKDPTTTRYFTYDLHAKQGVKLTKASNDLPKSIQQGFVLVKVDYASLNPSDKLSLKQGNRVGYGFCGYIKYLGEKVSGFAKDDLVYGWYNGEWGSVSEYVIAPVTHIAKVPPGIHEETGSALTLLAALASHVSQNVKKDDKVHIVTPSRMIHNVIEAFTKEKEAIIVYDKFDGVVDWYYHTGGPLNSLASTAKNGISWTEAQGNILLTKINFEEDFIVYKAFVEENAIKFKSFRPASIISKKSQLERAVKEIYEDRAHLIIIYSDVLLKNEEEQPIGKGEDRM